MPPKKVKTIIKLNLPAGEATPAPPVGPALGQHGLPIMDFVRAYNEKTADKKGSGKTGREAVGTLKKDQVEAIAREKMGDLNTDTVEQAVKVVEGTARSMGVKIE